MSGAAYVRWFKDIGLDEVGMVGGKSDRQRLKIGQYPVIGKTISSPVRKTPISRP